jgi:hypothetical protein
MDVSKSVDNSTPLSVKSCLAFVILFVYIYIRALIINHGGSGVTLPAEVRHRTLGTFKCINKSDRNNPYERIIHVGSMIPEGGRWKLTQVDAIAGIELGKWSFWVETGGKVVAAIVAVSAGGHKYLKTRNDGEQPTNLLILPECP